MGWHRIAWNGAVWCCMEWHWIALHRLYLYGVAFYVMVWHSVAWFGCIDRTYTLLLSITFWGASSKSDYLVMDYIENMQNICARLGVGDVKYKCEKKCALFASSTAYARYRRLREWRDLTLELSAKAVNRRTQDSRERALELWYFKCWDCGRWLRGGWWNSNVDINAGSRFYLTF